MRRILFLTTAIFLVSCADSADAPTIDVAETVESSVAKSTETQGVAALKEAESKILAAKEAKMKAAEAKAAAMKAAEMKAAEAKAAAMKAAEMKAAEAKAATMKAAEAKAAAVKAAEMKAAEANAAAIQAADVKRAEAAEAARVEAQRQASLRQEADRNAAAQAEAQRQEALRQEALRQEAAAQQAEAARQDALRQEAANAAAAYREVSSGSWTKKSFSVKGNWKISAENGVTTISLDDSFSTKNAPDLKIFLSPLSASEVSNKTAVGGSAFIAPLRSNKGAQSYSIPAGVNLSQYKSIIIHCEQYTKLWSAADL